MYLLVTWDRTGLQWSETADEEVAKKHPVEQFSWVFWRQSGKPAIQVVF